MPLEPRRPPSWLGALLQIVIVVCLIGIAVSATARAILWILP